MKYNVEIKETLSTIVEVEADSEEEALSIAQKNYETELTDNYVLTADDWVDTEISIVDGSTSVHLGV